MWHCRVGFMLLVVLIFDWNHDVHGQLDDTLRLELMPNQAVQDKAVHSNSVFTCVPKGDTDLTVENIRWLDPRGQLVPRESESRIYTETHGNALLLIIKKTERSDEGIYKCMADTAERQLETEFKLKPYLDITWVDVPATQHPVAGTDGLIKCEVNADPVATINWSKDGHTYKPGDRCKIQPNGIQCFPIQEVDNGSYTCRAVVSFTGRVDERPINVEVYVKPEIDKTQLTYEAIEENALTLACNAEGKPLPTYTWLDKNNESLKDKPGYLINVTDGIGTLKINRVSREDSGSISCVAKNVAGEDTAVMKVQVIVKPKINLFDGATVADGGRVSLKCYVQADPQPTVEFYNYGTDETYPIGSEYDNGRIRVFSTLEKNEAGPTEVLLYIMEINPVDRNDDGDYKCLAKNTGGVVSADAHLQVEYVPIFVNKTNEILSWINNSVNLTCHSVAIPNATITWSAEKNIDVESDTNIRIEGNQRTSTLSILPVSKNYFIRYECKAKNKLGEASHWITLKEALVPGNLLQVNFIHITATTVTIGLHGPKEDGGLAVENFVVEYWRDGDEAKEAMRRIWPAISPTYILEKLEPATVYYFRFAAENMVGVGPWTVTESRLMNKKSAPEEPRILDVEDGIANSDSPNKYTLKWEAPHDNGEKITLFEITFYPIKKVGTEYKMVGEMITKKVHYPGKEQLIIEDLEPGRYYKIEIRAQNEIGNSQPGVAIIKTLDDDSKTSTVTLTTTAITRMSPNNTVGPQPMTNFPTEIIIVIAVVAVVLIIIAIDVTCYITNKCGILMCLCVHMCNKQVPNDKVKEAHMEEGKTKDSNDKKKKVEDGRHVVDDDEAKDATEETPMIDGKTEKEQEVKRNAAGNDTNMAKDSVV